MDVLIALFVLVSVLRGARTGFLAGVFSLVGVVVGASLGSRIAPTLMPDGGNPIYGAGITLGSIVAFAVLGEVVARTIGASIRNRLMGPTSGTLDGLGGAALGFALLAPERVVQLAVLLDGAARPSALGAPADSLRRSGVPVLVSWLAATDTGEAGAEIAGFLAG